MRMAAAGWVAVAVFASGIGFVSGRQLTAVNAQQIGQPPVQQPTMPPSQIPPSLAPGGGLNGSPNTDANNPMRAQMMAHLLKMANEDRHKRLADDTTKLLALSTELKAEVDKTTKDEMSLEAIRKASEIEKLAHDVKQRMTN